MKLGTKLILTYSLIAVFLVLALIFAYHFCDVLCGTNCGAMSRGMQLFVWFALIALTLAMGFSLYFAHMISKPLKTLTVKTQAIAGGDYTEHIGMRTNTVEMDALIESVNDLAATLDAQQRVKQRMASDYTHEFRTPLANIQTNLEALIDGVFPTTNERLKSILAEILRLSRMVSQIDNLVGLESETVSLHKEELNLSELLSRTLVGFEANLGEKSIALKTELEPCTIEADRDKLTAMTVNLMSNAVKYTDPGGAISVSLHNSANAAVLTFADDGIGIAAEDLPHIFEHLYRTDTSRTRDTGGYGIGLSVARAIVTAHRGTITVRSEPGAGSVFTVSLPKV